jgi:hypothetical protein
MKMSEKAVGDELRHICEYWPVEPGDTISHQTANECGRRGFAERDDKGRWVPTIEGHRENHARKSGRRIEPPREEA